MVVTALLKLLIPFFKSGNLQCKGTGPSLGIQVRAKSVI